MISKSERDELKQDLDCRDLANHLLGQPAQQSEQVSHWLCPFHDDHTSPSLAVWPDGWKCFGCDAHGDHYDLVMRIRTVQFAEAHAWLMKYSTAGGSVSSTSAEEPRNSHKPAQGRKTWQDKQPDWLQLVDNAVFLLDTADGDPGQKYLRTRCIQPETWRAWSLGYVDNVQRWRKNDAGRWQAEDLGPAIAIPWTNGETIKAVQYRLLGHEQRYHQESGGDRTIFGAQHFARCPVLILVEGEINAVSIWQEARDLVDVLSFGPETNVDRIGDRLQPPESRRSRVIVWADKPTVSRQVQLDVGADLALRSPEDLDANDLLQRGLLRDFILQLLGRLDEMCTTNHGTAS